MDMMNAHGGLKPTADMIGDLQTVSNLEAPRTTRLYEVWYQQAFAENLTMKAGMIDFNRDFSVSENGGLYINSAFGVIPSISENTSLSFFPLTGLGATVKYSPDKTVDFLAGVFDGDLGDPDENIHNTKLVLKTKQLFSVFEGAFHYDLPGTEAFPGTLKLGGWYNSSPVPDVAEVDGNGDPVLHSDNYGGLYPA